MVAELDRRRRFVVDALNDIDGIHCRPQDGTFYSFFDVRDYMQKNGEGVRAVLQELDDYEIPDSISAQFSDFLLVRGPVYLSPGSAFGLAGEGFIRISEADRMEKLEQGLEAIARALRSI